MDGSQGNCTRLGRGPTEDPVHVGGMLADLGTSTDPSERAKVCGHGKRQSGLTCLAGCHGDLHQEMWWEDDDGEDDDLQCNLHKYDSLKVSFINASWKSFPQH